MIELLNQQFADIFDLFSQTKKMRLNVKGAQFFPLHEQFDKLAAELVDRCAAIAAIMRHTFESAEGEGEAGTKKLFTEVSRALSKAFWFLEAHLQA